MSHWTPVRPARDLRLDVIRGWLQVSIFVSHIANSFVGEWFIHRAYGLSDSSEQFLFLSGFMLGSVYTLKSFRDGWRVGAVDIWRRAGRLYRIHIQQNILFAAMLAVVSAAFIPGEMARLGWGWLLENPLHAVPAILVMIYQPDWMDILPVFVWGMLLLPPFMMAEARWGWKALIPSALLYLATQFGWVHAPGLSPTIGMGFDPFAWQFIYLLAAWLGKRALRDGVALPYRAAWAPLATGAAVLVLLVSAYIGVCWRLGLSLPAPAPFADWVYDKQELAWPRLVHALALAWMVAAFVPRNPGWMQGRIGAGLALLGRHSLEVFCLGLFLSYFASTALHLAPRWFWVIDPLMAVIGIAVLLGWARWLERKKLVRGAVAA